MSADKGPVTAIQVARAAGMPLLLAGKLRAADEQRYFEEEVRPLLGGGIAYVGEIDLHERVRLMHGAHALINPIAWDEPFGLVMVEAMACGVPVIATPRGSVPEIVDGRRERVHRVERSTRWPPPWSAVDEIDPSECRAIAELNYSPERMVVGLPRGLRRRHRERVRSARRSRSAPPPDGTPLAHPVRVSALPSRGQRCRPCHRRKVLR